MILETGRLRVGVIHNPPWTDARQGRPRGREIELVETFANSLNAEPQWQVFGMDEAFKALEQGEIDLLAGGLLDSTPYTAAGFTRPYEISRSKDGRAQKHVLAVHRGENRLLVDLEKFLRQREGLPQ